MLAAWWGYGFARGKLAARILRRIPDAARFVLLTLIFFPVAVMALHYTPVVEWDARSIWFFHGKALTVEDALEAYVTLNTEDETQADHLASGGKELLNG